MRRLSLILVSGLLTACSHGLQEVGFAIPDSKDGQHYIVTRDVVSSRWSASQAHVAGQFHCTAKVTSEEMAKLRADGNDHTWYTGCTPTQDIEQHKYVLTGDQSLASLVQGPMSAAVLAGGLVGMAALWPESNVIQNGGGASSNASAGASSSSYAKAYGGQGGSVNIRSKHGHW